MREFRIPIWKRNPFLRLLLPFIAGIILQNGLQISHLLITIALFFSAFLLILFQILPVFKRYSLGLLAGMLIHIFVAFLAALLTWKQDIRHQNDWFGRSPHSSPYLAVSLIESPIEKPRSWKALAEVKARLSNHASIPASGRLILYFAKDSIPPPRFGDLLLIHGSIQEIRNSGNPGGFDYRRYTLFQGITHQAYLRRGEYRTLPGNEASFIGRLLNTIQEWVLSIIRRYIPGKKECGLAEALLIGYKDDLDKTLVQSYTNTGVVHIIAISGLHLGLIYCLLRWLLRPLRRQARFNWISAVLVIAGLWLFSLLAGGQPSVLRSAVMFSCIVCGESLSRKTSIYNSLALSAFFLLCYNPYWLWDAGFQLSYSALLSILIFMKPIYHLFYFKNKLVDLIWQLNAVTIAAQVLTGPLCIYLFHQFPNYFLLTNLMAVPLSSVILLGEIVLCTIAFFPMLAILLGRSLAWLILLMNNWVEHIAAIPFAVWTGLQLDLLQCVLIYAGIIAVYLGLLHKSVPALKVCLGLLLFYGLSKYPFRIELITQRSIVIYHIAKHRCIDLLYGRNARSIADTGLVSSPDLLASRLSFSIRHTRQMLYPSNAGYFEFEGKRLLLLNRRLRIYPPKSRPRIDILILSQNANSVLSELLRCFDIRQVVIDATFSPKKARMLEAECQALGLPYHDVTLKGAFVMKCR